MCIYIYVWYYDREQKEIWLEFARTQLQLVNSLILSGESFGAWFSLRQLCQKHILNSGTSICGQSEVTAFFS